MKKVLLATAVAGLLATSGFAGTLGTVVSINQYTAGTSMTFKNASTGATSAAITVVGTDDAKKAMIAIGLTAISSGATIEYSVVQYGGQWGLGQLFIK